MFDGRNFLDFAKELHALTTSYSEAKIRTILGRAYYGLFLVTRELVRSSLSHSVLTQLDQISSDAKTAGRIHGVVLKVVNILDAAQGGILKDLREKRNEADYNLNPAPKLINKHVTDAFDDVDDYLANIDLLRKSFITFRFRIERVIQQEYAEAFQRP